MAKIILLARAQGTSLPSIPLHKEQLHFSWEMQSELGGEQDGWQCCRWVCLSIEIYGQC